jgi:AcrR family transcriptional regulator
MSDSETSRPASARRARGTQTAGPEAQQHLLRAADELFYREGVRTVGVDAVVERAGVNKMSLYRQFSSKDELVLAYLERKDEQFFGYVERVSRSIPVSRRSSFSNISTTWRCVHRSTSIVAVRL